jgi:hypothetical protein
VTVRLYGVVRNLVPFSLARSLARCLRFAALDGVAKQLVILGADLDAGRPGYDLPMSSLLMRLPER